jgi:hypothetical protein
MKILTFVFLSLLSFQAHTYSIFSLEPINWSRTQEVDVFLAGYGPEMGGLFAYSAITNARYVKEKSPAHRAQVIIWVKEKSMQAHRRDIDTRNLHLIEINDQDLTLRQFHRILMSYPKINSLHIYSHSSAWAGVSVQSGQPRVDSETFNWSALTNKFTSSGFVFLHGCNNGFVVAPKISEVLQRPVFGSFTGTDFQEIYSDKNWYHHNSGQYPSRLSKITWNDFMFSNRLPCWHGYCHRMKPNNHPYRGFWGRYETGLPYYKPFCRFGASLNGSASDACLKGVAAGLRSWPMDPTASNRERVIDFICPVHSTPDTRQNCLNFLEGKSQKRIFWGKTVGCDHLGCSFSTKNSTTRSGGATMVFDSADQGNEPFRKDYDFFMRALNLF